jgi:hypothetical protein
MDYDESTVDEGTYTLRLSVAVEITRLKYITSIDQNLGFFFARLKTRTRYNRGSRKAPEMARRGPNVPSPPPMMLI